MTRRRLRNAEVRELEQRVAGLPVAEADPLLDKAFSESGIRWLRRRTPEQRCSGALLSRCYWPQMAYA
jgi:hypothetical protein